MATEILQEYLTKLGFSVDTVSMKKFDSALTAGEKKVFSVGKAVAGVAAAVEAATVEFAYSMRKMYYDSQLSGASVTEMNKIGFASKQIGISAEETQTTLVSLGMQFKNPAVQAYAASLGVVVEKGKFTAETLAQLVRGIDEISAHSELVGGQIAENIFHLPAQQYYLYLENLPKFAAEAKKSEEVMTALGLSTKKTQQESLELATAVDGISLSYQGLYRYLIGQVLPTVKEVDSASDKFVRDVITKQNFKQATAQGLFDYLKGAYPEPLLKAEDYIFGTDYSTKKSIMDDYHPREVSGTIQFPKSDNNEALLALIAKLEGGEDDSVTPTGMPGRYAFGKYQVTNDTAETYNLDPNKLTDPAYNKMAADTIVTDLKSRFGNDVDAILAGYNGGPGAGNAFVKSGNDPSVLMPETQAYLGRAHSIINMQHSTSITVNSAPEPHSVAHAVAEVDRTEYSRCVRDARGACL